MEETQNLKHEVLHFNGQIFRFLKMGIMGSVFIETSSGAKLIKIFNESILKNPFVRGFKDRTDHEIAMINLFYRLAPQYSCGPAAKVTTNEGYQGLIMNHAGTSLESNPSGISLIEKWIACLQFMHMILLISDNIQMMDVKKDSIYFKRSGYNIQFILIDLGEWIADSREIVWLENVKSLKWLFTFIFENPTHIIMRHLEAIIHNMPPIDSLGKRKYCIDAINNLAIQTHTFVSRYNIDDAVKNTINSLLAKIQNQYGLLSLNTSLSTLSLHNNRAPLPYIKHV